MQRRSIITIAAAAALVGFSYGTAFNNLGSDPLTWLMPLFMTAVAVFALPGFTLVAMVCFVTGLPVPTDTALLLAGCGASAISWLALAAVIWHRRGGYARYSSAAD